MSNSLLHLNDSAKELKISLVENEEIHFIQLDDLDELKNWYFISCSILNSTNSMIRMGLVQEVSAKWGAVQMSMLEQEIASMRDQVDQLSEICDTGDPNPKIQKVNT